MSTIHSLDFAKPFESIDDYNFLFWGTDTTMAQDIVKKLIPDYKTCDKEIVKYAFQAALMAINAFQMSQRIVITDREREQLELGKKRQKNREKELDILKKEYGSETVARVLQANIYTQYSNNGGSRSDGYEVAKAWCIEQGTFDEIEYRAINHLPALGRVEPS